MLRPTDQVMTTIEKIVCYSVPKRRGHVIPCRATQAAPGLRERMGQRFIGVLQEGMGEAG